VENLLDLYGFVSVLLHAMELIARTVLLGGVMFWAMMVSSLAAHIPGREGLALHRIGRRQVFIGAAATFTAKLLSNGLGVLVLAATLDVPVASLADTGFIKVAGLALGASLLLAALALPAAPLSTGRRIALCVTAAVLAVAEAAGSHAVARVEGRGLLMASTALHQLGAAIWLGGLPALLAALKLSPAVALAVGRRYSAYAGVGVGLIVLGTLGFWPGYIGGVDAVYGTAYGAMSVTKLILLGLLLLFGLSNFLWLHHMSAGPSMLPSVRRFVECEMALGVAVLAVAASLTSVPPAVDLPDQRVTWIELAERFTPVWPRLTSPDHADLAIPAMQAKLDAEWQERQAVHRPQAYVPGEGVPPPRNAHNIAWSEFNHHWAGILVLLVGLAALLDATGRVPLARHWPLVFLGLAGFLLLRADPEAWPLGHISLLESMRDPETVQHRLSVLLVLGFALSEWAVRLGWLGGRVRFVFPVGMLAGGVLLLTHTHALANVKEALLVDITHMPLAVLALIGGCARWTELRGPQNLVGVALWTWPLCLVTIGLLLISYREA
jgi:copper resistance protein D